MAITLQTVLPQKVLPRAPSPNASSPNPGIRSAITQFIPASPDASLDTDSIATPTGEGRFDGHTLSNAGSPNRTRGHSITLSNSPSETGGGSTAFGLQGPFAPSPVGRKSMSVGVGSRRGIAHSSRILGVHTDSEAFDLSRLISGKVDVSFEGTLEGHLSTSPGKSKGKGKARDDAQEIGRIPPLFDVDLESGQPTPATCKPSRAARLLHIGSQMPWRKIPSKQIPAYQSSAAGHEAPFGGASSNASAVDDSRDDSLDFARPSTKFEQGTDFSTDDYQPDEELGAFDDDREQLLYAGAEDETRPGYFAPGDRSFGYNALGGAAGLGGYGGTVGFEAVTWREGGWMILSSVLVGVLITVAILISVDVIDWPGDGIGQN
ncbi:uncharacterized protein MEPE_04245 [Melanopsichium pennsylvanicum]|uniref:Uncharacterized protein n=2 Tax=Melanopsichium pennsylvanicum TaxID=63383 RepID=A0AAJ4XPG2_9BASI|nr:hypothetical protein BN887_05679 [Melanopsichium pennsylvanicum 4]SNX85536.1 uncharacterized protein MEPE_04245 [Melanopsichium pennsylvanicum]